MHFHSCPSGCRSPVLVLLSLVKGMKWERFHQVNPCGPHIRLLARVFQVEFLDEFGFARKHGTLAPPSSPPSMVGGAGVLGGSSRGTGDCGAFIPHYIFYVSLPRLSLPLPCTLWQSCKSTKPKSIERYSKGWSQTRDARTAFCD